MPPEVQFFLALVGPLVQQSERLMRAQALKFQTEAILNLANIAQELKIAATYLEPAGRVGEAASARAASNKARDFAVLLVSTFEIERVATSSTPAPTVPAPKEAQ